jgi:arabinose-5-phosphate isomerase
MHSGDEVPSVTEQTSVTEALAVVSRGGLGMTAVRDNAGKLTGIFTDGDLRRAMEKRGDLRSVPVVEVMTRNPRTIDPNRLAVEAVETMEKHRINQLLVVDANGAVVGALNMHDLVRAKVV